MEKQRGIYESAVTSLADGAHTTLVLVSRAQRAALAALDASGLAEGLFLPVSELNHLRQRAVDELMVRRDWAQSAAMAERAARVTAALEHPNIIPVHDLAWANGPYYAMRLIEQPSLEDVFLAVTGQREEGGER